MGSLAQTKASRFAPFKVVEAPFQPIETPSESPVRVVDAVLAYEPHAFPEASISPALPMTIREEILEFYAFVFCQGGFRHVGMTFEQFLLVVASVKPADLPATLEEAGTRTF